MKVVSYSFATINMAALETPLKSFLEGVAESKGVKLVDNGMVIELHKVNELGVDEIIGSLSYNIRNATITTGTTTRTGERTKEVRSIQIESLTVDSKYKGKKLGSLLLADAIRIGLENGCVYSTLDDMSAQQYSMSKNIYDTFGYVHKYVTEQKDGNFFNTLPEKQLQIPDADQLLKNYKNIFATKGGNKRTRKKRKTKRKN